MPNYHRDPAYPPLPFPGGFETLDDLRRRARMALDRLAETPGDSPLLVVTHSAFLRCFLETLDSRVARDFKAIQTAINTLEYNAGAWSIVQLNDGQ
jgi:broad specificity phosphatase PhoE